MSLGIWFDLTNGDVAWFLYVDEKICNDANINDYNNKI